MAPATWEEQQSGGAPSRCGRCGSAGRQVQQQGVQRVRGQGVQRGGSEMSAVRREVSHRWPQRRASGKYEQPLREERESTRGWWW